MRRGGGLFLLLLAAGAVAAAFALRDLGFDHDTRSLLRGDRVADAREDELGRDFGAEDILLVAWEVESAVDPAEFRRIRAVTEAIAEVEGLEEVYSIAAPIVKLKLGGDLRRIEEKDLATEEGRAEVAAALRAAPVYLGIICNPELDVVAVASSFRRGSRAERAAALREVQKIAAAQDRPVHVAGVTPLSIEAAEYAIDDLVRIGALALVVSIVVLFLLCRSVRETAVAVVATGLPPLYALGCAAAFGIPVTALGAALFPVLAVVGITSSVHLLNAYGEERLAGRDAGGAARHAARRLRAPIVLSLLTTAAAFVSLQATGVPAFRAGGYVVALGLVFAVPVVLFGIPAALAAVRPRAQPARARRLDAGLAVLAAWSLRRRRSLAAAGLVLVVAGVALAPRGRLQVAVHEAFQPDTPIAKTYDFLEERITATVPLDVVLHARPGVEDEAILDDLRRFDAAAAAIPGVDSSLSLATFVEFGKVVSPIEVGDQGALIVLRTAFPVITRRFEHYQTRRYRIKVRVKEASPPEVLDRLDEVARGFTTGDATLTGLYVRAVGTTRHLVRDLARGAVLMILLVGVAVALGVRSARLGLAAIVPNALPPALVFGAAALLGIALDVGAVAVGAVAVGLAVDDTLHVIFRLADERRAGRRLSEALLTTQRSVGRALVVSTVVLAAGLFCLGLSSFLPTARFGIFTAAAAVVALPADLLVLPAFVRMLHRGHPAQP